MGYAVNSAETSSHDPDQLSKAGELVDGHYSERALRNPPSLQALKLPGGMSYLWPLSNR